MVEDVGKTSVFTRICKEFTFHAAHQLPNHRGKCKDLHGHTYKVEVEVSGELELAEDASDECMVMDFDELKEYYNENIHKKVDHKFLNDVLPFRTTAENIARWIFETLETEITFGRRYVTRVRVWETPTSWAEVHADDIPPAS